jgi:serine/threonine protein kinase
LGQTGVVGGQKPARDSFAQEPEQRIAVNTKRVPVSALAGFSALEGGDRVIGVGATLNERFTFDKELGQGGMGTVYRATDQLLGRNVAVKLLKDAGTEVVAERIRLEAQILARLVHDKIVRLYDFGESEGNHFLVMEEVNGPSFSNHWRNLLLEDRLRICGQVAEALDYAHVQGVIHRDVKPGNDLLTPSD